MPLKFLTVEEFKSLQLEKEVTYNDFQQDNLSKLKNKNLKVYFVLKGSFHALTNWNRAKTINEKDASDFLLGSKELAEVQNQLSGEFYTLNSDELAMYDLIIGLEFTIFNFGNMSDPQTKENLKTLDLAISWFKENNAEAYKVLLER